MPRGDNKLTDEQKEQRRQRVVELYVTQGLSQQKTADIMGVTQAVVYRIMKDNRIEARPRANVGPRNGRYKDGTQSRLYRSVVRKEFCNRCGATSNLCIHHKNDDHYDNAPDNLEVLCVSCHMSHHKTEYWKARREGLPTPKSTGRVGWRECDHKKAGT